MKQLRQPYERYRTQVETPGVIGGISLVMYRPQSGVITAESGFIPGLQKQSSTYMVDVVTPGYAQRVRRGEIVNHPMSKVSTLYGSSSMVGGEFDKTGQDLRWTANGDAAMFFGFVEPSAANVDITNLIHLAQTSALAGIKKPDVYAGVALGELHKTLLLLVSPLRGLTKLLANSANNYRRDLRLYGNKLNSVMKVKGHTKRHKRLSEWKKLVKDTKTRDSINVYDLEFIPDMVLAYNLGWKPLMMDIDAILRKIPEKIVPERATSRTTRSDTGEETREGFTGDLTQGCQFAYQDRITTEVVVRAGVLYETGGMDPRGDFGTRLSDVPGTVIELIPFSFLVDYAINLSDYVEALVAPTRATALAFYTKTTIKSTTVRTLTHGSPGPGWTVTRQPSGSLNVIHTAVSRDPSAFSANVAYTPIHVGFRPPAQLQNVLSLFTKVLYGSSVWKAR